MTTTLPAQTVNGWTPKLLDTSMPDSLCPACKHGFFAWGDGMVVWTGDYDTKGQTRHTACIVPQRATLPQRIALHREAFAIESAMLAEAHERKAQAQAVEQFRNKLGSILGASQLPDSEVTRLEVTIDGITFRYYKPDGEHYYQDAYVQSVWTYACCGTAHKSIPLHSFADLVDAVTDHEDAAHVCPQPKAEEPAPTPATPPEPEGILAAGLFAAAIQELLDAGLIRVPINVVE